jgi:hypothetical protein
MSALREPASTNGIRNNSMAGAVVGVIGAGGALPTIWYLEGAATALTREIVGIGTENGVPYLDLRLSGVTNNVYSNISFESPATIAAAQNQVWTGSSYVKLIGGSVANLNSVGLALFERDGAGLYLTSSSGNFIPDAVLTRNVVTRTLTNAIAGRVNLSVSFGHANGVAVDITLRIGAPQLEQLPFATSPILTTAAAVTRARDEISIPIGVAAGEAHSQFMDFVLPSPSIQSRLTGGSAMAAAIEPGLKRLQLWNGTTTLNTANGLVANARTKAAWCGSVAGRSQCLNGGAVATDIATYGGFPSVLLGQQLSGIDSQSPQLFIHSFGVLRSRLSDAQLQALTAA